MFISVQSRGDFGRAAAALRPVAVMSFAPALCRRELECPVTHWCAHNCYAFVPLLAAVHRLPGALLFAPQCQCGGGQARGADAFNGHAHSCGRSVHCLRRGRRVEIRMLHAFAFGVLSGSSLSDLLWLRPYCWRDLCIACIPFGIQSLLVLCGSTTRAYD